MLFRSTLAGSWQPGCSASLPRDSICLMAPFLLGGDTVAASGAHREEKDGNAARALLRNAAACWQALASFPALGYVGMGQEDA